MMAKKIPTAPSKKKSEISKPQSLRVLMVEDSEDDALLIIRELKKGGYNPVYERVETAAAMKKALSQNQWEIILCDYKLPKFDAPSAIALLKETNIDIPLIIVSGSIGEELAVECMRLGALDYIMKNSLSRLNPAIARELKDAASRSKRRQAETQREAALDALRESENKYRFLTEKMVDMVWTVNMDLQTTYVSPSIFRVLGFTQEERMKQTLSEIITQKSIERVVETLSIEMERNRETGVDRHRSAKMELEYYHKDGSTIWFENVIGFIGDDQGNTIGVHGVSREITERKQAEEKLTLNFEIQAAMNAILGLSLEDITVKEFLDSALDLVLSLKWLAIESKGAIFLADKAGETLHLHVHKGFSGELYAMCSTVPFGHCLCGKAAATRAIQFADRVDERHDTRYEGMSPHGHYCVPILSGDHIMGVISLYVKEGHIRSPLEENFLKAVANSLAGTIKRKQAEEALRESEERYRALFDRSLDLIYIHDFEGRFIDANAATLNRLGYTNEEIHTLNFALLLSEDQLPLAIKTLQEIRETGIQKNLTEFRVLHKDGTQVYVETQGSSIMSNGTPVAILSIARDITDRKQTEKTLRESEKKYRELYDFLPIPVYDMDFKSNLTFVNRAVYKTFGGTEEDFKKRVSAWQLLSPEDVEKSSKNIERLLTGEKIGWTEYTLTRLDGSVFPAIVTSSLIYSDDKPVGLRGAIVDITERKQAEKELQQTLERLRKSFGTIIQVMVSTVEVKDPYTAGHQLRVANLARAIATEMGLPQDNIEGIRMAGSIHDIGKLSVPAEILTKPTKLTELEFSLIKEHARKGYEMLKDVESPWSLAQIVYQHHERMDGSGYPRNLKGDEILMEARIMAVADVVEAMASNRPYRPALGIEKALEEIEKNRGIFYDADAADACLRLFREKGFQLEVK